MKLVYIAQNLKFCATAKSVPEVKSECDVDPVPNNDDVIEENKDVEGNELADDDIDMTDESMLPANESDSDELNDDDDKL